jgi:hypothetical protein
MGAVRRTGGDGRWRLRFAALATAALGCIAGLSLVVANATGAGVRSGTAAKAQHRHVLPRATLIHGFNGDNAEGKIVNLTPYTWTFVTKGASNTSPNNNYWNTNFPATLKPGDGFTYSIRPQANYATTRKYNGFFTYKVDTVSHTEYLTVDLEGAHCTGICFDRDGPPLVPAAYNATRPPDTHNGYSDTDFGPATPNPEIGWSTSGSTYVFPPNHNSDFDFTFEAHGNYTLDASQSPPQIPALINALCANVSGTTCSFTQVGDIRWSIGDPVAQTGTIKSCDSVPPSLSTGRAVTNPPADLPDWHEVSVEAKRTKSVSVGGSLTASAEASLFGVIDTEVSAKIGVEHEWSESTTFEKTTRVYVPRNWVAGIWVAPVIGKVTGTLVVATKNATYTITNFTQTASGVSRDLTTPAFNIMTNSRQMTPQEWQAVCKKQAELPQPTAPPTGLG